MKDKTYIPSGLKKYIMPNFRENLVALKKTDSECLFASTLFRRASRQNKAREGLNSKITFRI